MTFPNQEHLYVSDVLTQEQSQALAVKIAAALQVTNYFRIKLVYDNGQLKRIITIISEGAPDGIPPMNQEKNNP